MLIRYLHEKEGQGIQDYLVNVLYNEDIDDIDFYLPQLCYMALTKKDAFSLEKFILDMCLKYSNIAIKAMLFTQTFDQDKGELEDRAIYLANSIETTIVNNKLPPKYITVVSSPKVEFNLLEHQEKIYKDQYKNLQQKYLDYLKYMTTKLKDFDLDERPQQMRKGLVQLNQWVDKSMRGHEIDIESDYQVRF